MAYGKAIKYSPGGFCLQSVSGNAPAKGEVAALGRKCAEGSDAFKRVYTFPDPGKTLYHLLMSSYKNFRFFSQWNCYTPILEFFFFFFRAERKLALTKNVICRSSLRLQGNLVLVTEWIIWIGHLKVFLKLTFRSLVPCRGKWLL